MNKLSKVIAASMLLLTVVKSGAQTVTDIDGNVYQTISIGTQVWMAENLKTTHFSNGAPIATTLTPVNNDYASIFQWAYNDDASQVPVYGRLYSWPAVIDNRNVCPAGWRVSSDTDWVVLSNYLGGALVAGGKLKETGTSHWLTTNSNVDNSSSFTALPGGHRGNPSGYSNLGNFGGFWTSSAFDGGSYPRGVCYRLFAANNELTQGVVVGNCGMSVRCLRNATVGIGSVPSGNGLQVFPNPAGNQLTIQFPTPEQRRLFVYALSGALLMEKEFSDASYQLNTQELAKGMYLLKVVGKDGITEQKWLKE